MIIIDLAYFYKNLTFITICYSSQCSIRYVCARETHKYSTKHKPIGSEFTLINVGRCFCNAYEYKFCDEINSNSNNIKKKKNNNIHRKRT